MLGLRLKEGVDVEELEGRTGLSLWPALEARAEALDQEGLLLLSGKRLRPTGKGLALLNAVVLSLWEAL